LTGPKVERTAADHVGKKLKSTPGSELECRSQSIPNSQAQKTTEETVQGLRLICVLSFHQLIPDVGKATGGDGSLLRRHGLAVLELDVEYFMAQRACKTVNTVRSRRLKLADNLAVRALRAERCGHGFIL
jgi:hypothetical protein